jgi:hypothetical protein
MPLGRLAPHLGQHPVVPRPLAFRHLEIVALEILHTPAHVQREIEHPLLIVSSGPHGRLVPLFVLDVVSVPFQILSSVPQ